MGRGGIYVTTVQNSVSAASQHFAPLQNNSELTINYWCQYYVKLYLSSCKVTYHGKFTFYIIIVKKCNRNLDAHVGLPIFVYAIVKRRVMK